MMNSKIISISFCVCILFFGYTKAQVSKIDSSEMVTLRIDPEKARGASISQIFNDVQYIPLETTNESLFGRISQLETTKDYFIIYDGDTKSILIFYRNGKYKTKIDANKFSLGNDDTEKFEFNGFVLRTQNNSHIISVKTGKFYNDFDLSGKFLKKTPLTESEATYFFPTYMIGDSGVQIKFNQPIKKGDDNYHELILLKNEKVIGNYFPFSKSIKYKDFIGRFGSNIFNYGQKNELFYVGWAGDLNIYKIEPEKVSLSYRFILPEKNSLPQDFNTNPSYVGKKQIYFKNNRDKYYMIGNAFQIGNNLFFNLLNSNSGKKSFLYNLKSTALISIKNIQPDQISSFLPITDSYFDYYGFHLYKEGYLYNSFSSLAMFDFIEQSKNKKSNYGPLLNEYFKTQTKKSNPVIVQLKPK